MAWAGELGATKIANEIAVQELPHKIRTERSAGLPAEAKATSRRNTPSIERLLNAGIGRQNGAARCGAILWGSS